jgi:enoyl-CoA hydratase/carnithine racemase
MPEHGPFRHISLARDDAVVTIRIERPEKHNALNTGAMLDLQRAFAEIQFDRSIDAVVVEGAGEEAFSAGADIEQYAGPSREHDPMQKERQERFYDIYREPFECHAPVIAKIDGFCVGGGLIFAMYCDLRIASQGSQFGVPTANIGQIPTGGATRRAVELVGEATAKELVFTAGYIDAETAHDAGLVNDVVAPGELENRVASLVEAIGGTGRGAVKNSKRAINAAVEAETPDAAREREAELWWEQFATEERRERVDEFTDE